MVPGHSHSAAQRFVIAPTRTLRQRALSTELLCRGPADLKAHNNVFLVILVWLIVW